LYAEFWDKDLSRVKAGHPDWPNTRPSTQSWLWMAAPIRACGLSSSFAAAGKIRHELYIDAQSAERSTARFEGLLRQKEVLEAALRPTADLGAAARPEGLPDRGLPRRRTAPAV
jgi:hypothetical protein